MEQFEDISFTKIAQMLYRRISFIVAVSLVAAVLSFLHSKIIVTPKYESSVTMYVKNEVESNMSKTLGSDIQTAQMLVDTYIVILKSDTFLNEVSERLKDLGISNYDADKLRKEITANAVDATEIFRVTVTNVDPTNSFIIANVIADVSPDVIKNFIEASSVKVLDYAVEGERVSPNVQKNMVIGLFIGMMLACIMVVIREIFDTRIKTEEELLQWFNIPILGVIPDINEAQNRRYAYSLKNGRVSYEFRTREVGYNAEQQGRNELVSKAKANTK